MDNFLSQISNPEAKASLEAHQGRILALLNRGVLIPCPQAIEVGPYVNPERIAPGVILHSGTRLVGARTLLAPGVEVGREGPALVDNTIAGHGAKLDGGSFTESTFLPGAEARSWAQMRRGTLLEEKASVAHCVGLKQSILFPYVTLGSLINFCDVLMAGGTGSKDHSEVGSGYIHFNFTPRGDKATASLYGDVPRGVFLREARIFLGGLGASVGPMTVGYGAFLGPGEVFRRNVKEGRFTLGEKRLNLQMDFNPLVLTGVRSKIRKNLSFIAQLVALYHWYEQVRLPMGRGDDWMSQVYAGGQESVAWAIEERVKQLGRLIDLLPASIEALKASGGGRPAEEQASLMAEWPALQAYLLDYRAMDPGGSERDALLQGLTQGSGGDYVTVIQSLPEEAVAGGQGWLSALIKGVIAGARALI